MGCEPVKCDIQLEILDGVKQFEGVCGKKASWLPQQEHDWGSTEKKDRSKWRRWWRLWWGPVWQAPLFLDATCSVSLAKLIWLVHSLQRFVPWNLYFSNLHWWPSLAHLPSCYIRNSGCHQSELLPTFLTSTWQSGKCLEPKLINILSIFWMYSLVTSRTVFTLLGIIFW